MILGRVSAEFDAIVPLTIRSAEGFVRTVDVVIDTGFNGGLMLPGEHVESLELPFAGTRRAALADGRSVLFDLHLAWVRWHDVDREVLVLRSESGALAGMSLLRDSCLVVDVTNGGAVRIEPLMS